MDINELKKEQSKFNTKQVKDIIEKIEHKVKDAVGPFHTMISRDNDNFSETQQYTKILDTIRRIKDEEWIMDNCINTKRYEEKGNIAVITNDVLDTSMYLILKALKTHSKIVFFVKEKIHNLTKTFIETVKESCCEAKYSTYIDYYEYTDFEEVYEFINYFGTFIFMNTLRDYYKFTDTVKDKNIIYSSYGTMSLYLDDKELEKELQDMDEYVYNNNIELDIIKDTTVQEAVKKINQNIENYCVVIFTKDTKKAYYFIENIKSKHVYVNKSPAREYFFELDDRELVTLKKISI